MDGPDRRINGKFTERLSLIVTTTAALGGFLVLLDPKIALNVLGQTFEFGGEGFSSELKGAVVTIMLLGGWTAVTGYWLGQSDSGQKQGATVARIAEQAAPSTASAVAAATAAPSPQQPGSQQ